MIKFMFICPVIVGLLYIVIVGLLNYSGFCFKEMRYLSDDEKIRRAVIRNYSVKGVQDGWYSDDERIYNKIIPYENVDEFLKKNKNCCTVINCNTPVNENFRDVADPPLFWEKVFNICNYGVNMKYTLNYIEMSSDKKSVLSNGKKHQRYVDNDVFVANNCGEFCRED